MTIPAGWYDDGSGARRWWDGAGWTEHVAEATAPADAATAAPAAPQEPSTPQPPVEPEPPVEPQPPAEVRQPVESQPPVEASLPPAPESAPAPSAAPVFDAPTAPAPPQAPSTAQSAPKAPAFEAPLQTPPAAPAPSGPPAAPPVPSAASPVPPVPQAPEHLFAPPTGVAPSDAPFTAPSAPSSGAYPAASGAYPATSGPGSSAVFATSTGHPTPPVDPYAPAPRARVSVLGLIGLGIAVVGVVLSFIPAISVIGWVLLGVGLVASVVSLFLRGAKWPGILGIAVTILGGVLAVAVSLIAFAGFQSPSADDPAPTSSAPSTPDDDSDDSDDPQALDPADVENGVMTPVIDLAVGDCIPLLDYDKVSYELPVVPCDDPHTDEVFSVFTVDEAEFPGEDALEEMANTQCLADFESFVGIAYDESELDFYSYWPTKRSWTNSDDRTIQCILYSYDNVEGTLEGSAR